MTAKRQHHIPQMLLKRFLGINEKIYLGNILKKKVEARSTETVGFVNHLYSIDIDGKKDDSLEVRFSIPEANANLILDKLEKDVHSITHKDVCELIEFVVMLAYRSPLAVRLADKHSKSEKIRDTLLQESMGDQKKIEFSEQYFKQLKEQKGFAFSQMFTTVFRERVTMVIQNFDVILCDCTSVYPKFILQDNYVAFDFIGQIPKEITGLNLWDSSIQFFCPLSKNFCLAFVPKKTKGSNTFNFSYRKMNPKFMENLNIKFLYQAINYIYSSCPLEALLFVSSRNN